MKHFYAVLLCSLLLLETKAPLRAQTWQWLATSTGSATSTGTSNIAATAADGAGNTVVAGTFNGTVTFGSTTLVSAGGNDIFVGRVSASGAWTQAVRAGSPGNESAKAIAVDNGGNVVVTGTFSGTTAVFGGFTLTNASTGGASNDQDIFVARLSPAGSWTQAVRVGGNKADFVAGLALDAAGTATIAGAFGSVSLAFGATTLLNSDNTGVTYDTYVARLSSAGTWTQAVQAGSATGYEQPQALAQDLAGNVYLTGIFSGTTFPLGTTVLTNADASGTTSDAFVARLSSAGTWTQAVRAGVSGVHEQPNAIALDGSGRVVVAGLYLGGATSFGPNALPAPPGGFFPVFVARLSTAGVWTQAVSGGSTSGNNFANALAVDASGNATVAGQLSGSTAQFGPNVVNTFNPGTHLFVARLSTAGTWTYALRAGSSGVDNASAVFLNGTTATVTGQLNTPSALFGFNSLPIAATVATGYVARLTGLVSGTLPSKSTEIMALLPNPTRGALTLPGLPPGHAERAVLVTDGLGREVRRFALPARATAAQLDLTGLAPGLYVVRCGAASGKVVVE